MNSEDLQILINLGATLLILLVFWFIMRFLSKMGEDGDWIDDETRKSTSSKTMFRHKAFKDAFGKEVHKSEKDDDDFKGIKL